MPFDFAPPEEKPKVEITRNLAGLSYALRHPEVWPAGFVWDYSRCSHCAIGLAMELFSDNRAWSTVILNEIIPGWHFDPRISKIFMNLNKKSCPMKDITPENVADAIDHYLVATAA